MDTLELMKTRHSVRRFAEKPLKADAVAVLNAEIAACDQESGLHLQLITEEPKAFQAGKPTYGQFRGCKNYLALVGLKGKDEEIGYYGERVVLKPRMTPTLTSLPTAKACGNGRRDRFRLPYFQTAILFSLQDKSS